MAKSLVSLASLSFLTFFCMMSLPLYSNAISQCNGPCGTFDDCEGELTCINGKCNDDPDSRTQICKAGGGGGGGGEGGGGNCQPSGTLTCRGQSYPTYQCSPPVTSSTPARLTNNDFSEGGDVGGPSECDGQYHDNSKPIVALSTGWYSSGSRCENMIRITASNGRSVLAQVVDECDSMRGCDEEHAGQPPCDNSIADGSDAVWSALGLDKGIGIVRYLVRVLINDILQ